MLESAVLTSFVAPAAMKVSFMKVVPALSFLGGIKTFGVGKLGHGGGGVLTSTSVKGAATKAAAATSEAGKTVATESCTEGAGAAAGEKVVEGVFCATAAKGAAAKTAGIASGVKTAGITSGVKTGGVAAGGGKAATAAETVGKGGQGVFTTSTKTITTKTTITTESGGQAGGSHLTETGELGCDTMSAGTTAGTAAGTAKEAATEAAETAEEFMLPLFGLTSGGVALIKSASQSFYKFCFPEVKKKIKRKGKKKLEEKKDLVKVETHAVKTEDEDVVALPSCIQVPVPAFLA